MRTWVAACLLLLLTAPAGARGPESGRLQRILWGEIAPEERRDVDEPEQDASDVGADVVPPQAAAAGADETAQQDSVSLGYPAGGSLQGGVRIPLQGTGYRFLRVVEKRGTHWGTEEILGLISRVGAAVAHNFPGTELRFGNVGARGGGKIPWSVSHRNGRDFDVLFLVDDKDGKALPVDDFQHFGKDGRSTRDKKRRFSVARNWAVVRALVMDPSVRVQRVFVASWLKEQLLAYGRTQDDDQETVRRADHVLSQPRYALDHSDHFHVRIYCSREDRLLGCHDYQPRWDWVEDWSPDVRRRVAELLKELREDNPSRRLAAVKLLRRLEAKQSARAVAARLLDANQQVRDAALRTLESFGRKALGRIAAILPKVSHAGWASVLTKALGRAVDSTHAFLLEKLVSKPNAVFHSVKAKKGDLAEVRIAASDALGRVGRKVSTTQLLAALLDTNHKVRQAAARGLTYLTNHALGGRWGARVSRKKLRKQHRKWKRWLDRHRGNSRAQWVRLGFKKKGIKFKGKMMSLRSVPTLMKALDRKAHLGFNAYRTLVDILGDESPGYCGVQRHCWQKWWKRR